MAIKVDMTSTDVDKQMALLKYYPEVMEKHFRPHLEVAVKALENEIRPNIPTMTSKAQDKFGSRIIDTKEKTSGFVEWLSGQIGWWGKNAPWYINIVEYGAKPHKIEAKEGGFLWFGGRVVKSVDHPGFSARGFMAAGFSAMQPMINAEMAKASEGVVNEMAVK